MCWKSVFVSTPLGLQTHSNRKSKYTLELVYLVFSGCKIYFCASLEGFY